MVDSELCKHGCGGKRHIPDPEHPGTWRKCTCLLIEERNVLCQAARIPSAYWDLTLDRLPALTPNLKEAKVHLLKLKERLQAPTSLPSLRTVVLSGRLATVKVLGYLLLKAALLRHRGLVCALDEMGNWFLAPEKGDFLKAREVDFLTLVIGAEYTQNIHRYLLGHLLAHRAEPRFFTVFVTELDQNGIRQLYPDVPQLLEASWARVTDELQIPPNPT